LGDLVIDGYAASDPEDARFLRIDSLVAEDDGSLSQLSLRLLPSQVRGVQPLDYPPRFQDEQGAMVVMPASFWPDDAG
jgi:hypothetical protein